MDKKDKRSKERLSGYHLMKYRISGQSENTVFQLTAIVNISASGVLFKSDKPLVAGTILDLKIHFPGHPVPLLTQAQVVRSREVKVKLRYYEIGVKFLDIDEEKEKIIDKVVKFVNSKLK